ncbi:MAG: thioesterase family protein, partial [Terriglobales bacterium]
VGPDENAGKMRGRENAGTDGTFTGFCHQNVGYVPSVPRFLCPQISLFPDFCPQISCPQISNFTHSAATPPGMTVTVRVKLDKVDGRKLSFSVVADDGIDTISEGTHERFVIDAAKFNSKLAEKIARADAGREA